jgi:hypothetical protein
MQRLLTTAAAVAIIAWGGAASAQTSTSNANSTANANTASQATGGAGGSSTASATNAATNAGNAQDIVFNSPATPTHTTTDVKSAPIVYAPALATTLTETCMGSTSAAGSGMGWGLSFGSTWEDKACERRLNADRVAGLFGDREAARAIMCEDHSVFEAFEKVGRPCPQSANYRPDALEFYPTQPSPSAPPQPPPSPPEAQAAPPPPPPLPPAPPKAPRG